MGFNGTRVANSTSADQPVASAIGTSGVSARRHERNATSSTSPTASRPRTSVSSRRQVEETAAFASAASTGRPASCAETPLGACSSERMTSRTSFWRSSGISRMPKAIVAVVRSRVMTLWEK